MIALNRTVAISNVRSAEAALAAVKAIPAHEILETYYLYHAVLGHFHYALGDFERAMRRFGRAAELTGVSSEQAFLARKLAECKAKLTH